ncbi:MAG: hypothetical protein B7Z13_04795 [Caulobacterales bacterium 32-67-6]|nr:MAG: hypothetical protein B7Z13_04795 [Caulobacterales bacterium 32-67-6]
MITIDRKDELELFSFLARQPKLREWVNAKLDIELRVLVQNGDVEQLRRAQGKAQLLQHILELLDKAPAATRQ